MSAYLTVEVKFRRYDKESNIVNELHSIYAKHGLVFNYLYCNAEENISYDEACKANQKCFDELILFEELEHYRMSWSCDWVSFVDTSPSIFLDYTENEYSTPHGIEKSELILFPEEECVDNVFSRILDLITDLYKLDSVHSIEIQKEE